MNWVKSVYARVLGWAHDSEVVLLGRGLYYGGVGIVAAVLSGFDYQGVIAGTVDPKKAVLVAAFGAALEWLRRHRAEDMK